MIIWNSGRLREVKRYASFGVKERFAVKGRLTFSVLPIRKTPCALTQNTLRLYAKKPRLNAKTNMKNADAFAIFNKCFAHNCANICIFA